MTYRTVRQKLADLRSEEIRSNGLSTLAALKERIGCEACKDAEENPMSGHFRAKCKECSARAIAGGPTFFEVAKAKAVTPEYATLMRSVFGESWAAEWHPKVKEWAKRLADARSIA